MAEYGVSRIVIRGAIEALQNEGLILKQQGKGTFFREQRQLEKRGTVTLTPTLTFSPSGGAPASFPFSVKLKLKKRRPRLPSA